MFLGKNSFVKKNPLQDFLSSLNAVISTNESTQIITGHVIYNLPFTLQIPTEKHHSFIVQKSFKNKGFDFWEI